MIDFRPVSLKDRDWISKIALADGTRSLNYNFSVIYVWNATYNQYFCRLGDRLLAHSVWRGHSSYCFPIGSGPLQPAVDALIEHTGQISEPLIMEGLEERHMQALDSLYPGKFIFEEDASEEDYVYSASALASYSGKPLHGKRNHCNRFESEHEWSFIALTPVMFDECRSMLKIWSIRNESRLDKSISEEYEAIDRAFENWSELSLEGGILIADGSTAAFSVGCTCGRDCFDVLFEKADIDLNGAYPMICRELSRHVIVNHPEITYINRENDLGLESLRISKLSYHPDFLIHKYIARYCP